MGFIDADNGSGGSVGHLAMTSGNLAIAEGRFFDPSNVKRSVALGRINEGIGFWTIDLYTQEVLCHPVTHPAVVAF